MWLKAAVSWRFLKDSAAGMALNTLEPLVNRILPCDSLHKLYLGYKIITIPELVNCFLSCLGKIRFLTSCSGLDVSLP